MDGSCRSIFRSLTIRQSSTVRAPMSGADIARRFFPPIRSRRASRRPISPSSTKCTYSMLRSQGDCLVGIEPRLDEDQIGTLSLGSDRGHRRMDAKLPCLVACRRDDAALARSADRDRLAAQLRIIALLDGCVESIHVNMDDLARAARLG